MKSALLVMDMQTAILNSLPEEARNGLLKRMQLLIETARKNEIPVIYVVVGFRPGIPEVGETSGFFPFKSRLKDVDIEEWKKIHPVLQPDKDEIIIQKKRISAFTGSDLEIVLRAMDVRHLILTGVATSGVVLSTYREAFDKDFRLTVLSDGCADADPEVHQVLTEKIYSRTGEVITIKEWIDRFSQTTGS